MIISFFRHSLSLLDADTHAAIADVVRTNNDVEDAEDLLRHTVSQDAGAIHGIETEPLTSWGEDVKQAVQNIIAPDKVNWMDDEGMVEESYVDQALDSVRDRFER